MVGMEEKWCSPTIDHRPYSILAKCDNEYRARTLLLQFNARTKTRRRPDELSPTSTLHHIICFFFCSWFESTNGQNRKSRVRMWRKFIYMLISGPLNLCTPASAIHQRVDGFHATHARRFYRFVIRLFGV